jgi:hypothetical protein
VIEKLTAQIKELQESNSKPTIETVPISSSPSTDHTPQRDHDDQIATKSAASTLSESTVAAYELRIQQLEAELALRDERIRELTCIPPSIPPATSAGDSSEQKIEALEVVVSDREETIRQLHSELSSQRERVEELEQNQERLLAVAAATTATTSVTTGVASTPAPAVLVDTAIPPLLGESSDDALLERLREEDELRTQEILRLHTQLSAHKIQPDSDPHSQQHFHPVVVVDEEDIDEELDSERNIPVDIPDYHDLGSLTEKDVLGAVEEFRNDLLFKYREMASAQDRSLQSLSSFQTKTFNTLKGRDPALVPPHEHLLFDRFRKRLLTMSRRVFRFSTAEKEAEEDVVKIE